MNRLRQVDFSADAHSNHTGSSAHCKEKTAKNRQKSHVFRCFFEPGTFRSETRAAKNNSLRGSVRAMLCLLWASKQKANERLTAATGRSARTCGARRAAMRCEIRRAFLNRIARVPGIRARAARKRRARADSGRRLVGRRGR